MSAINPTGRGVGFRHGQIIGIDTDGYPAATLAATPYLGYDIQGARQLTLTVPDFRKITHIGDDRVLQLDALPPNEGITGVLQVSGSDDNIDVLTTGQKSFSLGDSPVFLVGTDKQGYEQQVIFLAYRQSLDFTGPRRWEYYLCPKTLFVTKLPNFDDNPEIHEYSVIPQIVSAYPWGTAFSLTDEGATQAQVIRGLATGKPRLATWKADGATTVFTLPTAAVDAGKVLAFVDGVAATATLTTTTITFGVAPANGKKIICFYESV